MAKFGIKIEEASQSRIFDKEYHRRNQYSDINFSSPE